MHPVVPGEHRSFGIDHRTGPNTDARTQKRLGVSGGNEADVVTIGLVRDRKSAARRFGPDLRLGCVPDRECGVAQLFCGQHGQHIGLILVGVDGPSQPALGQSGVMTGGHRVKAQCQRLGGQRGEFDPFIAPHTRVRGLAPRVGVNKVFDHVVFKAVGEIPDVERDPEDVGDAASVGGILFGATSARPGPQRARLRRERQVHADHLMSGIDHPGGSDR